MTRTFRTKLRDAGNNATYEVTIPKILVSYLNLEVGKDYEFTINLENDN